MTRDEYVLELLGPEDEHLAHVRQAIVDKGMPSISVSQDLGQLLTLLVKMSGASRILEIGALGGYSGICLGRGLSKDGQIVSLELEQEYADFAHENLKRAGLGDQVEYRVGYALESLEQLGREGAKFDFFFIDADKDNYPHYLEWAMKLANPGAVLCADNVLRGDRVLDPENQEPAIVALREFNRRVATDERIEGIMLPLRDGFTLARIR